MKITAQHYACILGAMRAADAARPEIRKAYEAGEISDVRFRWDLVWAADQEQRARFFRAAYQYASDAHIDTALRRAIKELEG